MSQYKQYNPIREIEKAKKHYDAKKKELEELEYIVNCLKSNWIAHIRSLRSVITEDTLLKALNEKDERYKKDRPNFEFVKWHIANEFIGVDNIKITNILMCGMDTYAYKIEFEYNKQKYAVEIPIRKNITSENVDYAMFGKFSILKQTGASSWTVFATSYEERDIKEAFQKEILTDEQENIELI